MNRRCSGQAVPVPAFLNKSAPGTRYGIALTHDLYRTVTLITPVAIVFGINLRSPHIGSISFQRHHPTGTAEDACRTVVVDEEPLRSPGRLHSFLPEKTGVRSVTLMQQAQIVGSQRAIERITRAGQIARQGNLCESLHVVRPHLSAERMTSADTRSPLMQIAIIAHGYKGGFEMLPCLFGQLERSASRKSDKLSDAGKRSRRISRIEPSVVKSRSVYLDTAKRAGCITQRRGEPAR